MKGRLVIAAPASGQGKTSVTLGLAAALRTRGLEVAVCKVGPDYLDTGWHSLATGRPARNLDVWTMGERGVAAAFTRAAHEADIVLVEGVMGLFDGHRTGAAPTSTADVAALLGAPVVLVIDASHSGTSAAAVAHGFAAFDSRVQVVGTVLNRFGTHRERLAVAEAFARIEMPVLGWLPTATEGSLPSRHLGLVQSAEDEARSLEVIAALGDLMKSHADVDALLALACEAGGEFEPAESTWAGPGRVGDDGVEAGDAPTRSPRIAVARDDAFSFHYADNIEALAELGAELAWFSPLHDTALPSGTCGIYLSGGYPELFSAELSANEPMRAQIAEAAAAGVPIYAECGGMLYLLEALVADDGRAYPMAGVLAARARMTGKLQRVGYVEAELATGGILGPAGMHVRGHEFRYSTCEPTSGACPAWLIDGESHGFVTTTTIASYLHLNFAGCPEVARAFVSACRDRLSTLEDIQ